MENTLATILVVICLLVGAVGGVVLTPGETTTVVEEKIVTEYVDRNVTVEKIVEVPAPNQLDIAVDAFMKAVENGEDEAGREVEIFTGVLEDFYFDEVEIKDIDDEYTVEYDGDKTMVYFTIDLRFDDGDDRERESYNVKVVFEEDEDTKVTILA